MQNKLPISFFSTAKTAYYNPLIASGCNPQFNVKVFFSNTIYAGILYNPNEKRFDSYEEKLNLQFTYFSGGY